MSNKNQMKNKNGITLIALVLTIVIIIILAMITIVFLFGENGLLIKTQEAKKMTAIEEVREKLEMATGTAIIDGKGHTTIDDYFELIESEKIIGNKDNDTFDNGDGTYDVTTNEGFIFQVMPVPEKDNADDILIDYMGEASGPRIKNVTATTTTNSATIEVEAVNAENAVYKYEYKKDGEDNWQTVEGENGSTCIINNLEENKIYNIRVTVEVASGGNKGTATREINVRTGEMPTGAIAFEKAKWQGDGTASIVVNSSEDGYTIQYQIVETGSVTNPEELEEANWKPVANGEQITGIQHNQTVYARLWDGHNGSSYASADIKDTEVPQVSATAGGTTSNSVAVSVQVSDNESGMIESPTYTYSIKQTSEPDSSYTTPSGASNIATNNYTFTGLTKETSYDVKVEVNGDKAGNIGIGYLANQTTGSITGGDEAIQTGAITFGNTTWSNNLASITVSTNTNYTIQYQVNGTEEGKWQPIENEGTIGNLSYPSMVYARLYDGTNYGQYASAGIIDNTNPQNAKITLSSTSVTVGSTVKATVTHRDSESGPEIKQCRYVWNTSSSRLGTNASSYTGGTFSSNGQQISRTMSSKGTYYLHVLTVDKAGNKWETVSSGVNSYNPNTAPTVPTVSLSSKTNTSLTVTARSSDADGDTLKYTLYAGTSSSNLNKVSSAVSKVQNQTVTITLSGLTSYTYYYWRVDVSDGEATTKGAVQSRVRTYCYTTRCTNGYTTANGKDCSTCGGTGDRTTTCTTCNGTGDKITECTSCKGTGDKTTSCTSCGGDGKIICSGSLILFSTEESNYPDVCSYCGELSLVIIYINGKCTSCGSNVKRGCCPEHIMDNEAEMFFRLCGTTISCTICNGNGEISTLCTTCEGTGNISTPCTACNGNGETSIKCTTCGGDGKVTRYTYCSHGYSRAHYWCTHGNDMGVTQHD